MIRNYLFVCLLSICAVRGYASSQKQPLTVKEAVGTRRLATDGIHGEVAISPDETQVAYIVKAPDIQRDSNNYELYVQRVGQDIKIGNGRLLLHADHLSGLQWLENSREVGVISSEGKDQAQVDKLNLVDVRSGKVKTISSPTGRIRSFSADGEGGRIVFCAAAPKESQPADQELQNRYGFRVTPGEPITDASLIRNLFPDSYLYVVDSHARGRKVTKLQPMGPSNKTVERFEGEVDDLFLSPDGRFLLFRYSTKVPDRWQGTFYADQLRSSAFPLPLWGLLDLDVSRFETAFDAPAYAYAHPVWSADSRSFAVSALAPQGSSWEKQDLADGFGDLKWQWDSFLHLFSVEVKTGRTSEVLHRYKGLEGANVAWERGSSSLLVPLGPGMLVRLTQASGVWKETGRSSLFTESTTLGSLSRNGNLAIGLREDISTTPNLVVSDLRNGEKHVLTDWNPEYRDRTLGVVEEMSWVNKYGVKCSGYLIKPVGYSPGKKYPLVVMNKAREAYFVSDGSYTTAFPPQPLAGAGFAVLMAEYSFDVRQLPAGFPGGIAEAYNWMAMVESGVDSLVRQGIADGTKVGIIGFSRTGWKTDFMLTHSHLEFAAASSADSGLYNYAVYSLMNDKGATADADAMFGGPSYGNTLENWLKYAPAFNAQRVRCPVLMEYVGYGHMPFGPTNAYEFFSALYSQGKPVELFFYPLGDHPLDTPSERVASLQRNVDWFRFWLQGYEGTPPEYDPNQYERWRELRKEQERNTQETHRDPAGSE
jgi:dipeptidyl aminopeptidase/acylaminoacyl peptidase